MPGSSDLLFRAITVATSQLGQLIGECDLVGLSRVEQSQLSYRHYLTCLVEDLVDLFLLAETLKPLPEGLPHAKLLSYQGSLQVVATIDERPV